MYYLDLNGTWQMKKTTDHEWINGKVPGSVFNDLLNAGLIGDPFYRDNEDQAKEITSYDYEYQRSFQVDEKLLSCDKVVLRCEGLDTLAEIMVNGQRVGNTNNMHRTYEFDVKGILKEGENSIHVTLYSPIQYIKKNSKRDPCGVCLKQLRDILISERPIVCLDGIGVLRFLIREFSETFPFRDTSMDGLMTYT
jgi:Glycosyl hydrolases family 2, sugar binding domain.